MGVIGNYRFVVQQARAHSIVIRPFLGFVRSLPLELRFGVVEGILEVSIIFPVPSREILAKFPGRVPVDRIRVPGIKGPSSFVLSRFKGFLRGSLEWASFLSLGKALFFFIPFVLQPNRVRAKLTPGGFLEPGDFPNLGGLPFGEEFTPSWGSRFLKGKGPLSFKIPLSLPISLLGLTRSLGGTGFS